MGMLRREELDEKLWAELKEECERVKPDQPPPKTLLKKYLVKASQVKALVQDLIITLMRTSQMAKKLLQMLR